MTRPHSAEAPATAARDGHVRHRLPGLWAGLSVGAAFLSVIGCVVGFTASHRIYGAETAALADAARAQDIVGMFVVGPSLTVAAWTAARGSLSAWLCWLGLLSFTVYNYSIYAFSIHFGPLFLVWVAVLGLSLFALIGGFAALGPALEGTVWPGSSARWAGWFQIVVGGLFVLLWLSEVVPDLLAGRGSTSAADWLVPTNPVHVLDLAFFLPAVIVSGACLLRRHWFGYATTAGQLTFLLLTSLPVLVTPLVAQAQGHPADWSVMVPIGVLALATSGVLWSFMRGTNRRPPAPAALRL